jgi:tetratricopeptide (TPR) repeat protein
MLAVAATYGHTLGVPFYLDDFSSIQENSLIYRWQGFEALRLFAPQRVLGYLSFAANYRFGHFDPRGYHLVNILIHILAALAVYGLARGLLRTPRLAHLASPRMRQWLPLVAALLFAIHPLQTQAVTYVVQRLASMVAMFYLAALAAYVQARLADGAGARVTWAAASVLLAGCALFTKENSATLPLACLLVEAVLFHHSPRRLLSVAGAAFAGLAVVWTLTALSFGRTPFSLSAMSGLTTQSTDITRADYLGTQMAVIWRYLRRFIWPAGLHLDYAESLRSFADPVVLLALGGHLLLLAIGLLSWRRWPLFTFGLLFHYVAHAVESGVLPIPEMAFEHRAYLPNAGLCLAAGMLLLEARPRWLGGTRLAFARIALVLLALGAVTWQRNQQWRDPIPFWRDNVRKAPAKARAWGNLGKHLLEANQPAEAERALQEALRLGGDGAAAAAAHARDVVNLSVALQMQERNVEAMQLIERNLERATELPVRALLYLNRGNIQLAENQPAEAEASFRSALALEPFNQPARANLASVWAQTGRLAAAESLFQEVLAVDPDDAALQENLLQVRAARLVQEGNEHRRAGRAEPARQAYQRALHALEQVVRLNPSNSTAQANLRQLRAATDGPR